DGDADAARAPEAALARGPGEDAEDGGPGARGALRRGVAGARVRERDRRDADVEPAHPRRRRDDARAEDRIRAYRPNREKGHGRVLPGWSPGSSGGPDSADERLQAPRVARAGKPRLGRRAVRGPPRRGRLDPLPPASPLRPP